MTIAVTNLATGAPSFGSSFTTSSITNATNALILITVFSTSGITATSVTGLGLTWVLVATVTFPGSQITATTFRALGASSTGTLSVTLTTTAVTAYIIDQFTGVNTNGTNGSGAIAQNVTNTAASNLSISLSALGAGSASYGVIQAFGTSAPTITAGSGYSPVGVISTFGTDQAAQSEVNLSGSTTVNWLTTSATQNVGIGFEIVAATLPFSQAIAVATLIAANFASYAPWPYDYFGAAQPYAQKQLNPQLTNVVVNNPPFENAGRSAQQLAIEVQAAQPDPWVYDILGAQGGLQPYAQRKLNPAITNVPVNNPPFSHPGRNPLPNVLTQWQPDPWPPVLEGGRQAYEPRRLSPQITNVPVNNPPFTQRHPLPSIIQTWQPDPWVYNYSGLTSGNQPYASRQLSPAIPGQSADNPPFDEAGRQEVEQNIVTIWQPDPWTYTFFGNAGPFMPKTMSPAIPGQSADNPPWVNPGRRPQAMVPVYDWQPAAWPYVFMGGQQPYEKSNLPPVITAVPIQVNYHLTVRNVIVRVGYVKGPFTSPPSYPPKNQG